MADLVEPTEAERKNKWTAESLTRYLAEREAQKQAWASGFGPNGKKRPREPVSQNVETFDPHKW